MNNAQQTSPQTPLEIDSFSGGITDDYSNAAPNQYQTGHNFFVEFYGGKGKLVQRYGSTWLNTTDRYLDLDAYGSDIYRVSHMTTANVLIPNSSEKQRTRMLVYFTEHKVFTSWLDNDKTDPYTLVQPQVSNGQGYDADRPAMEFTPGTAVSDVWSTANWEHFLLFTQEGTFGKVKQMITWDWEDTRLMGAWLPIVRNVTYTSTGSAVNYIYRVLYRRDLDGGDQTYIDRGQYFQLSVQLSAAINSGSTLTLTIDIRDLTTIADAGAYDSNDTVIEVYRTTDDGANFFLVGEKTVPASGITTTFVDNVADADLINNEVLYTETGLVEFSEPPACSYLTLVGTTAYFGNIIVPSNGDKLPYRLQQSIPGNPRATSPTFYIDMPVAISGIGQHNEIPIVMLINGEVYRIDGEIDPSGAGDMVKTRISREAGCICHGSIVSTDSGCFWAGIDGFYWSDGINVTCISEHLSVSYRTLVTTAEQRRRIRGSYDIENQRVHWTCQPDGETEATKVYTLDLKFGVSAQMTFTTWGGGDNFTATALFCTDDRIFRGTRGTYLFQHEQDQYSDIDADLDVPDSDDWVTEAVRFEYLSTMTDFGSSFVKKWVPNITMIFKNLTDISVDVTSINDDGLKTASLQPVRYRGNLLWGDEIFWGTSDLSWNYTGLIKQRRRFPARSLRCQSKQVGFSNSYAVIVNSSSRGLASIDAATRTITNLSMDWDTDVAGFTISFPFDDYTRRFTIESVSSDELVVTDDDGFLIDYDSCDWIIEGYPKDERIYLLGYSVSYSFMSHAQTPYRFDATGEMSSGS